MLSVLSVFLDVIIILRSLGEKEILMKQMGTNYSLNFGLQYKPVFQFNKNLINPSADVLALCAFVLMSTEEKPRRWRAQKPYLFGLYLMFCLAK